MKRSQKAPKRIQSFQFLTFSLLSGEKKFFFNIERKISSCFCSGDVSQEWLSASGGGATVAHSRFSQMVVWYSTEKSCSQLSWVLAMDLRDVFIYAVRSWSRTCRLSFIKSTHDEEEKKPTLWMKVGIAAQKRDVVGGFLIFVFISHSLTRSRTHITLAVTHVLPPITLIPFFSTHLISPSLPSPISRFCCSFFSLHHMLVDSFQSLINSAMRFNTKKI